MGEASPLPGFSRETVEQVTGQLSFFASSLLHQDLPKDWLLPTDTFVRELDGSSSLSPSARFSIELALWNLYAASEGGTLSEVICRSPPASVPVNGLLSGPVDEVLAEGGRMREAGYGAVKLKVGGRGVEEGAELVLALGEVLGEGVALRLDANRAWSFAEAARFARIVEESGYEYIEEPLADPSGLAKLGREHGVPVALDESLVGMAPEELRGYAGVRAVVIKPTLVGGISQTLRLADEARRLGIMPVISAAYETGVGTGALLVLAATTGAGEVAAGLDTYRRLDADVLSPPLSMASPRIDLPETLGAKRELDRRYLSVVCSSGG